MSFALHFCEAAQLLEGASWNELIWNLSNESWGEPHHALKFVPVRKRVRLHLLTDRLDEAGVKLVLFVE
tara:strand:- start:338 stop:544 length:207 start_codon:yes stop_codon:yes gene_type:complete